MKLRARDYIRALYVMVVAYPARQGLKRLRYKVELGGRSGYEVNGIDGYWGRYATVETIVELAGKLKNDKDWFSFNYPTEENPKYSHTVQVHGLGSSCVTVEFIESTSQSGSYEKVLRLSDLLHEIETMSHIALDPESYGYEYKEW